MQQDQTSGCGSPISSVEVSHSETMMIPRHSSNLVGFKFNKKAKHKKSKKTQQSERWNLNYEDYINFEDEATQMTGEAQKETEQTNWIH